MKRPLSLLAAAVVIVLVAAGCGSSGVSSALNDAATLTFTTNGKQQTLHVTRDQLLSEVGSIVANKPFNTYLKSQKFDVSANLTTDSKISAIWLSQLIEQQAIDSLFASRHLKVTPAVQAQAAKDVVQVFPDPTIFPAFSSQMRTTLTDRQARTESLLASYTDTSDAAGQAYYKAHASQFACASGKDVAHILLKTQAEAQAVLDQLKGGASFATLAEKDSTDTTSGEQGGALGCLAASEFVAPFQTAADKAPVGTPIGPVHSQFGYHVILVTQGRHDLRIRSQRRCSRRCSSRARPRPRSRSRGC